MHFISPIRDEQVMCERCDSWEEVIVKWFGEPLLTKLEAYVREDVDKKRLIAQLA
jgi:hypothetical protein